MSPQSFSGDVCKDKQEDRTNGAEAAAAAATDDSADAKGFNFNGYSNHLPSPNKLSEDFQHFTTITEKDDSWYNLSEGKRLALVFNHSEFQFENHPKRGGTESDCDAIRQTFGRKLGFEVRCHGSTRLRQS